MRRSGGTFHGTNGDLLTPLNNLLLPIDNISIPLNKLLMSYSGTDGDVGVDPLYYKPLCALYTPQIPHIHLCTPVIHIYIIYLFKYIQHIHLKTPLNTL